MFRDPLRRVPCVALTGGIACGKSLFGRMLAERGADVEDADAVVHRMQGPGEPLSRIIGVAFGADVLDAAGGVDRGRLGALVFSDPRARARLESLVHPRVREWFQSWCRRNSMAWAKVALIPLLFESGWEGDWDWTVCLACSPERQAARLRSRGLAEEDARRRIQAQWPQSEKMKRADLVVHNDAGLDELSAAADQLKRILLEKFPHE